MEFSHIIPIVAIAAPFVMIIIVQVAKTNARTQQERMRCEVMRAAIERGQPIPAEALRPLPDEDDVAFERQHGSSGQNDVRTGLICIGVGAGLYLMLATFSIGGFDGLRGLRWVGAIPGFVGVALLAYGMLHRPASPAVPPLSSRPTESTRDSQG